MSARIVILGALGFLAVALAGVWLIAPSAFDEAGRILDRQRLEVMVARAGLWGPVLIVMLMTVAIVASPIPSAPIALAAGAAYGHYIGTVYVALGAELGAIIAFGISRTLGREPVRRFLGEHADYGLFGSQNALTLMVFGSRLLPFISFDAMSYAAGLSALHGWRFALATLAGILPTSFVLAHFGSVAMDGGFGVGEWIAIGLGLVTGLPLIWVATRRKPEKES